MTLPENFLETMRGLLGEEYSQYLSQMEQPSHTALRVNTLKISPEEFQEISPFALKQIRWTHKGFYFDASRDNPGKHPYYYAGLYYIQEPSAMIPASILPVEQGDKVLDLCAAPGGKATELAAKLQGTGLLVANDISVSRAMALAKNLQVAGVQNSVVTAETPERLGEVLPGFFDKVLVDAPCSGEGMFRRDSGMVRDWMEHGPGYYAPIQRQILSQAYRLLRPGGTMVYSTCTFSPKEDEGMVQWFLQEHPDMHILPVPEQEGFSKGRPDWVSGGGEELCRCVRIFPHKSPGEGHFATLLQKAEDGRDTSREQMPQGKEPGGKDSRERTLSGLSSQRGTKTGKGKGKSTSSRDGKEPAGEEVLSFLREIKPLAPYMGIENKTTEKHTAKKSALAIPFAKMELSRKKDTYFLGQYDMKRLKGLRQIYAGVILGEQKKNRFEPSPQMALALERQDYPRVVNLTADDQRVIRFLKGETLQMETNVPAGYVLLCVDGYPLGWCKGNGTSVLKNKYYPGWRLL